MTTGQNVVLVVEGRKVEAEVVFGDKRSLALSFDAMVPAGDGFLVGMCLVLQQDDGSWVEILTQTPVEIVF